MKKQFDYDEDDMHQHAICINMPGPTPRTPHNTNKQLFKAKQTKNNLTPTRLQKQKIANRVSQILHKKEIKINQWKKQQFKKEQKQCTFTPKMISKTKKTQKRTLNEFLQHQNTFQKKVQNKRTNLKYQLEDKNINQGSFRPTINKKSKNMSKNKQFQKQNEEAVHQRLYALKDKQNLHPNININLFIPRINQKSKNIRREDTVQNLLYEDAQRRKQKLNTEPALSPVAKTQRSMSVNNQKYAANKFIKQYCMVLQKLQISQQHQNINGIVFRQILIELSFIKPQQQQTQYGTSEDKLINQAYQFVAAHSANIRNIYIFVRNNPIDFQKEKQPSKNIQVNQSLGRKINSHFQAFKRNRLSNNNDQKPKTRTEQQFQNRIEQKFTFHPKISKVSEQLAEKRREQTLMQATLLLNKYPQIKRSLSKSKNGKMTNNDLLVLKNMVAQQKIQKKKQEKQKLKLAECTFKPSTKNGLNSSKNLSTTSGLAVLAQKKCLQLYNQHKDRIAYRQYLHSNKRDPEEQAIKLCTFSPSINPFNLDSRYISSSMKNSASMIKSKNNCGKNKSRNSGKRFVLSPHQIGEVSQFDVSVSFGQEVESIRLKIGDHYGMDEMVDLLSDKYELNSQQRVCLHELLRGEMQHARLYNQQTS